MHRSGRPTRTLAVVAVLLLVAGVAVHLWLSPGLGIALVVVSVLCHLVAGGIGYHWWRRRRQQPEPEAEPEPAGRAQPS